MKDTKADLEWLSLEQAAARAGIDKSTMSRRVSAGKIAYHRDGRKLLIHADDLERYIAGRKVPARRVS